MSLVYRPQKYGQTEVVNKCLEAYLRSFITDKHNKWLHLAEWWYNSTSHTSAKMTYVQALYGYAPPRWKEIAQGDAKVLPVKSPLEKNQRVMQVLKDNLTMAQNHMKQQADQHRTKREFEVAYWVSVKLHPFKKFSLKHKEIINYPQFLWAIPNYLKD